MKLAYRIAVALLACSTGLGGPADFKAGIGRVKITPQEPIWLSGYAARNRPSEGVVHDLWVRAVALEDSRRNRLVFIGTDLIALPKSITDPVAARLQKEYGLDRARLVFTATHTHAGPVLPSNLTGMYDLDAENTRRIRRYGEVLAQALFDAAAAALGSLEPARVYYGAGRVDFAINRRQPTPKGIRLGVNPDGPTDHTVPVIQVTTPDGKLRAVLFAYACHNTTLGQDFYQISGDYAGFAQLALEDRHPGATAIFYTLCAGDQNPNPRSNLEMARRHGEALAAEVERVLAGATTPLSGPIRAAFLLTELRFAHHTRETFEQRLNDPNPHRARHARLMLKAYDQREPIRTAPYPVQAVRFGRGLTLLALGGEVVIDYQLRLQKEYGGREPLIVAAFCNDVAFYVPSLRVLREGGYEAHDSMIYYGMPGPFDEDVEDRVMTAIRRALQRVGR